MGVLRAESMPRPARTAPGVVRHAKSRWNERLGANEVRKGGGKFARLGRPPRGFVRCGNRDGRGPNVRLPAGAGRTCASTRRARDGRGLRMPSDRALLPPVPFDAAHHVAAIERDGFTVIEDFLSVDVLAEVRRVLGLYLDSNSG